MVRSRWGVGLAIVALAACAPRIRPLVGAPYAERLPGTSLAPRHGRIVFRWQFDDRFFGARGEGVARIAPPDSARLDFFADGGLGGGYAILVGDSLFTPANDDARRYLPPVPLLWAALGVLRVSASDTTARLLGDTLSADIGESPTWRATFVGGELRSLARIDRKRLRESVRRDSTTIAYRNFGAHRQLTLTVLRRVQDPPFDETIWRH